MNSEVKRGLKLAGEYLRLPPADGQIFPQGYPSKFVGSETLQRKRSKREEWEIYSDYYKPKHYTAPKHCPDCGEALNKTHKPGCCWQDNTTLFKTYRPGNPRDDSRRQAPKTSKPNALVEKFLKILQTLKGDHNTRVLYYVFWLKFKEERENVEAANEMKISESKYKQIVKELYVAVYSHLQAEKQKKSA